MKRHLPKILILVFAVIFTFSAGMGRWLKERYEKMENVWIPMTGAEQLIVDTSYGSIKITGSDTNDCNVSAKITASAPTTSQAKLLAEQTKIVIEKEENTVFVRAQKPEMNNKSSVGISYIISVPKKTVIECKTSYGNLRVSNIIGNISANTSYGDVIIESVSGKLRLNTSYGKVDCKQITCGDLTANSSFGDIFVNFSPDSPNDIRAIASTSYGDIDVDVPLSFTGDVSIDTSFGKINTDLAIIVKGELSKSHLSGVIGKNGKGLLDLKTSFGSVKIE